MSEPRYIDANLIPYQLDIDEESPMEGALIVTKGQVDRVPTADVAPVVHGRWEVVYNSVGKQEGQCTHCGKNSGILITKKSYCPNCVAKMDGSEEE